jgi:hypothetical protein
MFQQSIGLPQLLFILVAAMIWAEYRWRGPFSR